MTLPDPSTARAAIAEMQDTLRLARVLVESGRAIDLTGLDAGMAALCAALTMLPGAAARPMRPDLLALLAALDGLGAALAPAGAARGPQAAPP